MKCIITLLSLICGCVPTEHPQIYPDSNVGNSLSMPKRSTSSIIFTRKSDVVVEGREIEGIPTIMIGVKF